EAAVASRKARASAYSLYGVCGYHTDVWSRVACCGDLGGDAPVVHHLRSASTPWSPQAQERGRRVQSTLSRLLRLQGDGLSRPRCGAGGRRDTLQVRDDTYLHLG